MSTLWTAQTPVTRPNGLHFRLIDDFQELVSIFPQWEELLERSSANEPMLAPAWVSAWWDIYGSTERCRLRVGLFYDDARLVGLAPLQLRHCPLRIGMPNLELELLGTGTDQKDGVCAEYLNIIAEQGREKQIVEAFTNALCNSEFGSWHCVSFSMIDGEHLLAGLLQSAFCRAGLLVEMETADHAPYISLPQTWENYLHALGKNRRFLKKSLRDFDAWAGNEAMFHHAATDEQLETGKEVLRSLHASRWQATGQSGAFSASRFSRFHDRVLADLLSRQALDLCWLTVRGQAIAAIYNIVWKNKIYFYQSGRAIDVPAGVRPGIVLHAHCIRRAIESGCREYDFLAGPTQYKRQLALASRPLMRIRAAKKGFRENNRKLFNSGYEFARRVYRRIKPSTGRSMNKSN